MGGAHTSSRVPWYSCFLFGVLLVVAAITAIGCQAAQDLGLEEKCVITATGNKLCGDDAKAWCDLTDRLRRVSGDLKSQAICDDIRGQ